METIIASIVTALLGFAGVCITNSASNHKASANAEKNQAVTNERITELTREVREHNNFARRVPVIEEQMKAANHRIDDLEKAKKQ